MICVSFETPQRCDVAYEQIAEGRENEIKSLPGFHESSYYLVNGLLLLFWGKLSFPAPVIRRIITDDGRAILGRIIDSETRSHLFKSFGETVVEKLLFWVIHQEITGKSRTLDDKKSTKPDAQTKINEFATVSWHQYASAQMRERLGRASGNKGAGGAGIETPLKSTHLANTRRTESSMGMAGVGEMAQTTGLHQRARCLPDTLLYPRSWPASLNATRPNSGS